MNFTPRTLTLLACSLPSVYMPEIVIARRDADVALVGGSEENKVCKKDRGLSRI